MIQRQNPLTWLLSKMMWTYCPMITKDDVNVFLTWSTFHTQTPLTNWAFPIHRTPAFAGCYIWPESQNTPLWLAEQGLNEYSIFPVQTVSHDRCRSFNFRKREKTRFKIYIRPKMQLPLTWRKNRLFKGCIFWEECRRNWYNSLKKK
jgi:hypothetical protein